MKYVLFFGIIWGREYECNLCHNFSDVNSDYYTLLIRIKLFKKIIRNKSLEIDLLREIMLREVDIDETNSA